MSQLYVEICTLHPILLLFYEDFKQNVKNFFGWVRIRNKYLHMTLEKVPHLADLWGPGLMFLLIFSSL